MGVFAWVRELKRKEKFEIATYKHLGDEVEVSNLADDVKERMHWIHTGIVFYVTRDSNNKDFRKAVQALMKIMTKK